MPLNNLIPNSVSPITRQTAITIADVIAWLHQNKPETLKMAFNAVGIKEARDAANALEDVCKGWR